MRASFIKYMGPTIIRQKAEDCSDLERSLIDSSFVFIEDHYEHPDPTVPFAVKPSGRNGLKGYFFAGYNVGEQEDKGVAELTQVVNQEVGTGNDKRVSNIGYQSGCLLVRYAFSFDAAALREKEKVLMAATGINDRVRQALGKALNRVIHNVDSHAVYIRITRNSG